MTYADDSGLYTDEAFRGRAHMCIREQAYVFSADGRPDIAQLGRSIVAGSAIDIDSVLAAVVTAPGAGDIEGDDQALLSQTQAVWPTVAAARYPQQDAT